MKYREIKGDLIKLALQGSFDVIAHGCNCFCTMRAGIAPQMAKTFECDKYELEAAVYKGDITKLGTIDFAEGYLENGKIFMDYEGWYNNEDGLKNLYIVNAYTQYNYGKNHKNGELAPLDYEALTMCMRKINHIFKGKHIGLPMIGCGLAGGIWSLEELPVTNQDEYDFKMTLLALNTKDVKTIIQQELKDCNVTVVKYQKEYGKI